MKQVLKIYPVVAIIAFNTILLSLVALIALEGLFEFRHFMSGKGQIVHSDGFDLTSFRKVPMETAREIAENYDEWGSTHPLVFNPWTTFMIAPYSSPHINIRRGKVLNHRQNGPDAEKGNDTEGNPFIVWAFGGSTMFGFGVSDQLTIPAFIERHLASNLSGRKVKVVNFGQPYWYSTVEASAYLSLLRVRQPPQVVLFLDGLNDVSWGLSGYEVPVFSARGNKAWERERLDAKRALPWFSANESFPLTRVMRALSYSTEAPISPESDPYRSKKPRTSIDVSSVMIVNYRMIKVLSEAVGTKMFVFIQPTPWFGAYSSEVDSSFHFGSLVEARATYDKLVEASQNDLAGLLIDLTSELSNFDTPYLDNVHYSDAANELLALKISETILRAF